jgi:type IV pilus assembly protein PilA
MRTRSRTGFTLIELLIVVVIIGILAAIAIPKFGQTRERANEGAIKSDLRNLLTAQELYFGDNNAYANTSTLIDGRLWSPSDTTAANRSVVPDGTVSFAATLTKGASSCSLVYYANPTTAQLNQNGVPIC